MKTNLEELTLDYVHHRLNIEEQKALEKRADDSKKISGMIALYEGLVKAGEDEAKEYQANELGWQKLSKVIDQERKSAAPAWSKTKFSIWQMVASVVFSLMCWQGFVSSSLYSPEEGAEYVTVGEESERFLLMVSFKADANIKDIEHLLRLVSAKIIYGPTPLGLYELSFPDDIARDRGLVRLREADFIVEAAHFSE